MYRHFHKTMKSALKCEEHDMHDFNKTWLTEFIATVQNGLLVSAYITKIIHKLHHGLNKPKKFISTKEKSQWLNLLATRENIQQEVFCYARKAVSKLWYSWKLIQEQHNPVVSQDLAIFSDGNTPRVSPLTQLRRTKVLVLAHVSFLKQAWVSAAQTATKWNGNSIV